MGACLRPLQIGRHSRAAYLSCLAAVLCVVTLQQTNAARPVIEDVTPVLNDALPATDQFVSIVRAHAGTESVTLSARLSKTSTQHVEGISWQVANANGETLIEAKTNELHAELPPGEYKVTAVIGHTKIVEPLTLPQNSKLDVSYVLNAGALRVLPRIAMPVAADIPSTSKIFARTGSLKGQMIATTTMPGEVLMLAAGGYRIESTYTNGNVSNVTDIQIKPGIMSAIDINHVAGLVTFSASQAKNWKIATPQGAPVAAIVDQQTMVLKPGQYVAIANDAWLNKKMPFEILAGQQIEIALPE